MFYRLVLTGCCWGERFVLLPTFYTCVFALQGVHLLFYVWGE